MSDILGNDAVRMHSPIGAERDEEDFECTSKSKIWIRSPNAWDADRGISSPRIMAEAWVLLIWLMYFRFETKVRSPGPASSIACDPRNLDILVSNHPTVNSSRDFRKLHKTPQIICR